MLKLAVIGDPIEHSKSPEIHSAIMRKLGIDCEYGAFSVKKGELSGFVQMAKEIGITGFNVTMPHKVDIITFLDVIDTDAKVYNSVNTVKIDDGKLHGYNTDGEGFCMSLKDEGAGIRDKEVVFLGAGGVVNTLAQKMAMEGANKIVILNRTLSKAEELCGIINEKFTVPCICSLMDYENICMYAKSADILINATPLGMSGMEKDFNNFGFLDFLKANAVVSDLIYNPSVTNLMLEAQKRGHKTVNGMGMLIYQALIADEIYTGIKIDGKKKICYELQSIGN